MNVLRRVLVALVVPLIGYLLAATIFNHFYNQVEPGDLAEARLVATVKSCERRGPVAWRGFGYYHECELEVRISSSGETYTSDVTGWLAPEDIGKQYAVHAMRHNRPLQPDVRSQSQVFIGWLCTFVFSIAYLMLIAWIASHVWPGEGLPGARRPAVKRDRRRP
ncbi:hypothetical protein SAMN05216553_10542 [Lentzea fradiae]|uniref:Uncharacterized protein n=1 Tax=Lentzea fradiae TaxID=200378 RepID=A0A1G7R0P8_9PSEU|nr:DUF6346 domain-containing protein [Lentzea fradiae]SDG04351.1 hypothetical protein SAMN05216553_10542 [Lentzea fradiae]